MNDTTPQTLDRVLRAAAEELARAAPDPGDAQRTLAAMRSAHAARRPLPARTRRRPGWKLGLALLAGLPALGLAAAALLVVLLPPPSGENASFAADASDFVPLVPASRWSRYLSTGEDGQRRAASAWLVPTEIPADRLALLGLPYDPALAGRRVHAELLMHDSGELLAVRIRR